MSAEPVGFVGVGMLGGAMASRVLAQGGAVVVADAAESSLARFAGSGATVVASPADVARHCPVTCVVVKTDAQVHEAVLGPGGVLEGARSNSVIVIHSTIHLGTLETVAAAAAAASVTVLDAAVTGGTAAVERGELAVMVGGEPAAVDQVRATLEWYASIVWHAGPLGAGMSAKVAVNAVQFAKMAAIYEGLLLAHTAGLDAEELARIIAHSESVSGMGAFYMPKRAKSFSAAGSEDLVRQVGLTECATSQKDLHAAIDLAERLHVDLPVVRAALAEMPGAWNQEI